MAIKVTRGPRIEALRGACGACGACGTEVECSVSDTLPMSDSQGRTGFEVKCPMCRRYMFVTPVRRSILDWLDPSAGPKE